MGNWNEKSSDYFDYLVGYQDRNTLLYFCDSGSSHQSFENDFENQWPAGQYCILRGAQTTSCPTGFALSERYMDDEDDGNVDEEAVIVSEAINGPPSFALYPKTSTCQKFKYYSSTMVYIRHDNEDDNNNNQYYGDLPYGWFLEDTWFYVCAYWQSGVTFSDGTSHKVIDLDNPDLKPPANSGPELEFRFDDKIGMVLLFVVILPFVIAFVCCRIKGMCRGRKGKYGPLSVVSDTENDDIGVEELDNLIN